MEKKLDVVPGADVPERKRVGDVTVVCFSLTEQTMNGVDVFFILGYC